MLKNTRHQRGSLHINAVRNYGLPAAFAIGLGGAKEGHRQEQVKLEHLGLTVWSIKVLGWGDSRVGLPVEGLEGQDVSSGFMVVGIPWHPYDKRKHDLGIM